MKQTLGACSLCGGRVSVPTAWMSVNPPVPCCESCGARPKQPHGAVIDMEPSTRKPRLTQDQMRELRSRHQDTSWEVLLRTWDQS
jgi:hypothetical protein